MIFGAHNEKNESTCDLALNKRKTVTRRLKTGRIYKFGHTYAIQRSRGAKSEGTMMITSRINHLDWIHAKLDGKSADDINRILQREAKREGFLSWKGLLDYMAKHKININDTLRYRFKLIN